MFTGPCAGSWDAAPTDPMFGSWIGNFDDSGVIYTGQYSPSTGVTLFDGAVTFQQDGVLSYNGVWLQNSAIFG
jgi:hypothetical protein